MGDIVFCGSGGQQEKERVVTSFRGKAALLQAGLLSTVEAMMANPMTPEIHRLAWIEGADFVRSSNLINGMGAALGLTSAQIDHLFDVAETIEV
jgi:protein-disulfide isomerase-like protein with CxxC motif